MKNKRNILIGIGIGAALAAVMLTMFSLGMVIGRRENKLFPYLGGRHTYQDFYSKNFNHGAIGIIESLGEKTIVVRDRTGGLKTVLVDSKTQIRRGYANINFFQLKINEQIIVLGEPEKEGEIKARLIRAMGNFNKDATHSGSLRFFSGELNTRKD